MRNFSHRSEPKNDEQSEQIEGGDRDRLAIECSKLNVGEEQAIADEGLFTEPDGPERKRRFAYKYSFLAIAIICLMSFISTYAQSEKRDARLISYAQNLNVSKLDTALRKQRFKSWFRSLVGANVKMDWEINDCGEQTGIAGDGSSVNPPLCAEVNAELTGGTKDCCFDYRGHS